MDREHELDVLKAAFTDGRLTKDEFDKRVAETLTAYASLDSVTADIPRTVAPVARAAPERSDNGRLIKRGTAAGTGVSVALAVTALLVKVGIVAAVIGGAMVTVFMSVLLAGILTLLSWALDRASAARATPRGPAGPAPVRPAESRGEPPHHRRDRRDRRGGAQACGPATALAS
jgi:hypothetical protein